MAPWAGLGPYGRDVLFLPAWPPLGFLSPPSMAACHRFSLDGAFAFHPSLREPQMIRPRGYTSGPASVMAPQNGQKCRAYHGMWGAFQPRATNQPVGAVFTNKGNLARSQIPFSYCYSAEGGARPPEPRRSRHRPLRRGDPHHLLDLRLVLAMNLSPNTIPLKMPQTPSLAFNSGIA